MEEKQLAIFIIIANLILLIFIGGIIVFVFQFKKRQKAYLNEKKNMEKIHQEEILRNQIDIQAKTMKFIGQEIHDNVGQKITLASLYINQLLTYNTQPQINEIGKILNDSLSELRQLSKTLVQPDAAQKDLLELLKQEANQVNLLGASRVILKTELRSIAIDFTTKHTLLRVVQEFVQNSLKHAKCRFITIEIKEKNNKYELIMQDDGVGFDTNLTSQGIGLTNMKRRIREIGGNLQINSELGKGTTLELTVDKQAKTHEI